MDEDALGFGNVRPCSSAIPSYYSSSDTHYICLLLSLIPRKQRSRQRSVKEKSKLFRWRTDLSIELSCYRVRLRPLFRLLYSLTFRKTQWSIIPKPMAQKGPRYLATQDHMDSPSLSFPIHVEERKFLRTFDGSSPQNCVEKRVEEIYLIPPSRWPQESSNAWATSLTVHNGATPSSKVPVLARS
jgi:hypothetical protein